MENLRKNLLKTSIVTVFVLALILGIFNTGPGIRDSPDLYSDQS